MAGVHAPEALDLDDIDSTVVEERSRGVIEQEKQVRITLHPDAPGQIELTWHPGRGGQLSRLKLQPGKSIVQPLGKAQAWFGPFSVPEMYRNETDENKRDRLRKFYAEEKMRFLNRYDYPRPRSMSKEGVDPIGPHRAPDVIVEILNADEDDKRNDPIRLHQLYKIGEWDPLKDTFHVREPEEVLKARYEKQLEELKREHETQSEAARREIAEMRGMLEILVLQQGERPKLATAKGD